jgi:oxygen-independent coproporphyrinogen-3 oxidase
MLGASSFDWYEVSNWATGERARCRHNEGYWRGGDWWGVGPGAHSHVGGVRWWNVRHPTPYAERLTNGLSPAAGREVLTDEQRRSERVLLEVRTVEGLDLAGLDMSAAKELVEDGLLNESSYDCGRAVLTLRGRLLADAVVRALVG